jgi:hypothetical protein
MRIAASTSTRTATSYGREASHPSSPDPASRTVPRSAPDAGSWSVHEAFLTLARAIICWLRLQHSPTEENLGPG